jgi:hypothetical protein
VSLETLRYLITLRAVGSMRKEDIGRRPQTSPSICIGTCVPGDVTRISCDGKDFIARSRGALRQDTSQDVRTQEKVHHLDKDHLQLAASQGSVFCHLEFSSIMLAVGDHSKLGYVGRVSVHDMQGRPTVPEVNLERSEWEGK